jgi:hypothetical protein
MTSYSAERLLLPGKASGGVDFSKNQTDDRDISAAATI